MKAARISTDVRGFALKVYTAEGKAFAQEHGVVRATCWTLIAAAIWIVPCAPWVLAPGQFLSASPIALAGIVGVVGAHDRRYELMPNHVAIVEVMVERRGHRCRRRCRRGRIVGARRCVRLLRDRLLELTTTAVFPPASTGDRA